jgi:WhiB family redox-sensing transcriptional regulator
MGSIEFGSAVDDELTATLLGEPAENDYDPMIAMAGIRFPTELRIPSLSGDNFEETMTISPTPNQRDWIQQQEEARVHEVELAALAVSGSVKLNESKGTEPKEVAVEIKPKNMDWKKDGNCYGVDPKLFFPETGVGVDESKQACNGCEVEVKCLEFALEFNEEFGVWGGKSERERRKIRRQRAQAARLIVGA